VDPRGVAEHPVRRRDGGAEPAWRWATADSDGGLGRTVLRVVGELKAACLGPAEIAALTERVERWETRRRLEFLGRVASAYDALLARVGRADRHDRERRVLAMLQRARATATRPRALVGVTRLVIAEIYDYSVLQFLLVRSLIGIVGDAVLITLAHPEHVDASRFVERTWNRFVADPAIADAVLPEFVVRGGRAGALARLLAGIFIRDDAIDTDKDVRRDVRGRRATADGDGTYAPAVVQDASAVGIDAADNVRVCAAPSRRAEVEEVGRRIHQLLAGGTPPERLAILARELGGYRDLIAEACERYDLPVAFRRGPALRGHGIVQWVLNLLHTVTEGLPRDRLAGCLHSSYARFPRDAAVLVDRLGYVDAPTLPLARCLEREAARLARVRDGGTTDVGDGSGAARVRTRAAWELDRIRRHGSGLVEIVERLAGLDGERSVAEHVTALVDVLAALGAGIAPEVRGREAERDGAALGMLVILLRELAMVRRELDGGRAVPFATFTARLVGAIDATEVELPSWHGSGVRALAIADARGLDFDAVFVVGLDDGTFPALRLKDPLLDDGMRAEVNRHAAPVLRAALGSDAQEAPLARVLRGRAELRAEDPFLFYLALSTAERQLVLTYPTHDENGNPLVRSPYIDAVLAVLPGAAPVQDGRRTSLVPATEDCRAPVELVDRAVLRAAAGAPGLLAAVDRWLPGGTIDDLVRRIEMERRRGRYFLLDREREPEEKERLADEYVGRLAGSARLRSVLTAMEWSPSRLDELGACGFKFLAHRVLGLESEHEESVELSHLEEGGLIHRLLERLLRQTPTLPVDREGARILVRTLIADARHALAQELRGIEPTLLEIAWERAAEVLEEFVCAEATLAAGTGTVGRRERRLEWPFRFPIADHRELAAEARLELTLAGVVDRVDLTYDEGGRVIRAEVLDYKNTKRRREYRARLGTGANPETTSFQIPVYALSLRASPELRWAPDAVIEAGYVLLRADDKRLTEGLSIDVLALDPSVRRDWPRDAANRPIANRIVELVDAAIAGGFEVAPRLCDPRCAFRLICRYQPPPPEEE